MAIVTLINKTPSSRRRPGSSEHRILLRSYSNHNGGQCSNSKDIAGIFPGMLLLLLFLAAPLHALQQASTPPASAIATAHPLATEAGIETLRQGGNAFDAAVAVTAVLAVVEPYSSGIGGGGFYLLHRHHDNHQVMLDARERAPLAASRDMYLDAQGKLTSDSMEGPLSAGIPGIPAALAHLAEHYGNLPLQQTLAPAIRIAQEGFAVDDHYRRMATMRLSLLQRYPQSAGIFLQNNAVPETGYVIRQPDLAKTLEKIAKSETKSFYSGKIARQMAAAVAADGGIWSVEDLAQYAVIEREPIRGEYRGWKITSASPPSSGGIALVTMLNILERYDLEAMDEAQRIHTIVEAMRHAYRDRALFLGDADFVEVPVERLASKQHADKLRAWIRSDQATPSATFPPVTASESRGEDTTHFSILDREGNRVAATLSINYPFGSGYVVPETGVLLNDEMDDFSAKPGVPNAYGLVGSEANAIAPGKRPLSSMTPTFIENDERLLIFGTPGGSRIISMVLLGALEFMRGGDAEAVVNLPRFHHQYLPDRIHYEDAAISDNIRASLASMSHLFGQGESSLRKSPPTYGNMQAVTWEIKTHRIDAASDLRGGGYSKTIHQLPKAVNE
jgi:gamma-glutamyltranspeptidase / glutathione hydrolase